MSGRTVYIVAGTTEGNRVARRLQEEGYRVVLSVATPLGAELAACGEVDVGRKDSAGFIRRAGRRAAEAIVDCSHPFAEQVSREAASAAEGLKIPLYRFSRPESPREGRRLVRVRDWDEAVAWLRNRGGRALMTIGVNRLELFTREGVDLAARVLPDPESVSTCLKLGLAPRDIIAAQPPHGVDFNRACLRHAEADVIVAKDSGDAGGLDGKIEAAEAEDTDLLLVCRPMKEEGAITDLDLLVRRLGEDLADV